MSEKPVIGVYVVLVGRAVNGLIAFVNQKDCYLPEKIAHLEGLIALFGGGIEGSESPQDAAIRELTEETGSWWETARLPGSSSRVFGLPAKNGLANLMEIDAPKGTVVILLGEVDVSHVSSRLLQKNCAEAIAIPLSQERFNRLGPDAFVPGAHAALALAFEKAAASSS